MTEPKRVEGWKQIAAYLGRSERTVRRWQQEEGLPVHRHVHQERGSVWAYESEIDAWLEQRTQRPRQNPGENRPVWHGNLLRVAVAAITVSAMWFSLGRRSPRLPPTFEPLTSLTGKAFGATFSPDGRRIAFAWGTGTAGAGIYIKEIGSERMDPLVLSGGRGDFIYSPSWSPDGKTIAYLRRTFPVTSAPLSPETKTWLCLMASRGGPEVRRIRLASGARFYSNNGHLSWSLDGSRILAPMADGERRGIYWIPVTGGEPRQLTQPPDHDFAPLLSPDGRAMLYMRRKGLQPSVETLYYQRLQENGDVGGEPEVLFEERGITSGLGWLDRGSEIVVCHSSQGVLSTLGTRLFRLRMGGERSPLAPNVGNCESLAVYHTPGGDSSMMVVGRVEGKGAILWRARLDALDQATPFAPSGGFNGFPSYSLDGSLVAFVSSRGGDPEVWLASREGGDEQRLTDGAYPANTPRWSADGSKLVFSSALPSGAQATYTVGITDGASVPVSGAQDATEPIWAEDGEEILYWSGSDLWRTTRDGPPTRALQEVDEPVASRSMENRLFFVIARESNMLYRMDLTTGKKDLVADELLVTSFAVTPKFVYFLKGPHADLHAAPISGGESRLIGRLPVRVPAYAEHESGLAVSPDDREAIWSVLGEQSVNLMLVRDLR